MVDRTTVIASVRALLVSRQIPATLHEIDNEYRQMEGMPIPTKKMGYRGLEDFFRSDASNFSLLRNKNNELVVMAVMKQESSHIVGLVSRQKSSRKKRPVRSAPIPRQLNNSGRSSSQWPSHSSSRPSYRRNPVASRSARIYCDRPGKDVTYSGLNRSNGYFQKIVDSLPRQERKTVEPTKRPILKASSPPPPPRLSPEKKPPLLRMPHTISKPIHLEDSNKKPIKEKPSVNSPPPSPLATVSMNRIPLGHQKVAESLSLSNRLQRCREPKCNNTTVERRKLETVNVNNNIEPSKRADDSKRVEFNGELRVQITNRKVHSAQDRLKKFREPDTSAAPVPAEVVESKEIPKLSSIQMRLQRHKQPLPTTNTSPAEQVKTNSSVTLTSSAPTSISSKDDENDDDDGMKLLAEYCDIKGLPDLTCKIIKHDIKNPKGDRPSSVFGCLIKVGNEYTYGSYSDFFGTQLEARNAAALTAYEALLKVHGTIDEVGLPISDANVVVDGIYQLVSGHIHGKFANQIPADYRAKFHENLPENWLRLVESSNFFTLEEAAMNNTILFINQSYYNEDFEKKVDEIYFLEDVKLPIDKGFLNVFITCVCSTVEVWGRVIGKEYSVVYEELMTDMEVHFLSNKTVASKVLIGAYYAVSTPECWIRVKVLEIKNNTALCFSIDTGDEETYELSDLYHLDPKFLKVPAQAFLMRLLGLEDYASNSMAVPQLIDCLLNKSIVADIIPPGPENPIIERLTTVVLYDTSTEEDINLNILLFRNLSQLFSSPKLEKRIEEEVYISHISDDGEIYIQLRNDSYNHLKTMITNVTETGVAEDKLIECRFQTASSSKLHLLFHSGLWYRVAVTNQVNDREVSVFFVDTGRSTIIYASCLLVLDKLSEAIANFPHQAMKVYLTGIPPFTPTIAARLRGLLHPDTPVLLKVIKPGQIPGVEVYIRTQPNNLLTNINSTLQFEQDMEKCSEEIVCPIETLTKKMNRLAPRTQSPEQQSHLVNATETVESFKRIIPVDIPALGSTFPVLVTMAANPGNFVVQPYKPDGSDELSSMMSKLQEVCTRSPVNPPDPNEIRKGDLFAGLHEDAIWYRVLVNNVMINNSVAVQFIDYGDYAVISCNDLQPLNSKFRELPSQAVKARLSGISPENGDWSVIDCLRFQQLVCNKTFVAILKNVEQDKINPSDVVLSITLIDTSTPEDVYINKELIRAKN